MTYTTVPVNLVGGSNPHRASSQTSERLVNLYPEPTKSGQYPSSLLAWPGAKAWSTGTGSVDRGIYTQSKTGVVYKVTDTTLYSISSDGTQTSIGTITGTGMCSFSDDGVNLNIATGGTAYTYNGTTLSTVTDSDYVSGNTVATINGYSVWQGNDNTSSVSEFLDSSNINPDSAISANSSGDDLLADYEFKNNLYRFGTRTVETWYRDNNANSFIRIQNAVMPVGVASYTAVTTTNDHIYWLGDDAVLYRTSAYQAQSVMTNQVAKEIATYTISDCRLYNMRLSGQNYIIMIFPTQNKCWAFSELGEWIELEYGATGDRSLISSYTYAYGKHLISSRLDGNVYEWDLDTYTDAGAVIRRERVLPPINASNLGKNGGRLLMSRFELICEKGVGLITGQGEDPVASFEISYDQGNSYTNEVWIDLKRMGEARAKVEWYNMGSFYDGTIRIRITDPVFVAMHSAVIDLKGHGW